MTQAGSSEVSKAPGALLFAMVAVWVLPISISSLISHPDLQRYWDSHLIHAAILGSALLGALALQGFEHLIVFWRTSSLARQLTQLSVAYTVTIAATLVVLMVLYMNGVRGYFDSDPEGSITLALIPSVLFYWLATGITALVTYLADHA